MRVWLLKISEPIPMNPKINKGRTAMLAEKLEKHGNEVLWWVSSFDHQKKKMVLPDGAELKLSEAITIKALKGIQYEKNFSLKRYFDHWLIAWKFKKQADMMPAPDLIITAMPDYHLAWEAVSYAKKRKIPIVVDIRDPWPDVFFLHIPPILKPFLRMALFFDLRKLRNALKGADAITSMVSDWLDWGISKTGRNQTWKDRVFYIGAPRQETVLTEKIPKRILPILDQVKEKFVVTFIGTFNRNYEPTVLVDAAKIINEQPNLKGRIAFVLAGDGVFFQEVKERAKGVDHIFLPGWVNREEMEAIQSVSSVGVVPSMLPTEAFPNKAFGYFSAGLPVLSSNDGDLPRMLAEYEAGYHFERGNSGQLAHLIMKLFYDPGLRDKMACNAKQLFLEELDADIVYESFVDHVTAIAHKKEPIPVKQKFDSELEHNKKIPDRAGKVQF